MTQSRKTVFHSCHLEAQGPIYLDRVCLSLARKAIYELQLKHSLKSLYNLAHIPGVELVYET
jgi:hypothetical protein